MIRVMNEGYRVHYSQTTTLSSFSKSTHKMIKTHAVGHMTFTCGDLMAPIALAQPWLKN